MRKVRLLKDLTKYNPNFVEGAIGITDMVKVELPQAPWGTFYNVTVNGATIPIEKHGLDYLEELITQQEFAKTIEFTHNKIPFRIIGNVLWVVTPFENQKVCDLVVENYGFEGTDENKIKCAKMCIDAIRTGRL